MELKDFIKETIEAIIDSTSDLQSKYEDNDILINPPSAQSGSDVYAPGSTNYTMRRVQNVEFDVAVTAGSESEVSGGAKIKVLSFEVGTDGGKSSIAEQVSRVSFRIPITLKPSAHEQANINRKEMEELRQEEQMRSFGQGDENSWP